MESEGSYRQQDKLNVPRKEITGTPTFRCLCQNRTDDPISSCRCILFAQRSVRPTREHVPLGL